MRTEQEIKNRIINISKMSESFNDENTLRMYVRMIEELQWVLGDRE